MKRSLLTAAAGLFALALPSLAHAQMVNAQTGTTYTVLNTDCDPSGAKLVTFNNAAGVAVTLPQAGGSGAFLGGCRITYENLGLGAVTITPATSTINNTTALVVGPGSTGVIYNDSTPAAVGNYWVVAGASANGPSPSGFRNLIQNGGMGTQQRGTGTITCAANAAINNAAYTADRWGCSANVAVGAGRGAASTTTPPAGLPGVLNIFRTSGALTQPIIAIQEIATADVKPSAGNVMTLSFYAKADAGLSADNGSVINSTIITGTGADEGLQTMTASPAITPAWTGVASANTKAYTITTSYVRYSHTFVMPSTATEAAVAIGFTPTATGAGATDGFFVTGVQLENGSIATPFELKTPQVELAIAQRHYMRFNESAAITAIASCHNSSTTLAICQVPFPVTMRVVPTMAYTAGFATETTAAGGTLGACSALATATLVTSTAANVNGVLVGCTATTVPAAGTAGQLFSNNGSGVIQAFADY